MAIRIRHIATRFALILAAAAVLPLVLYGVVSILSLQQGTRDTVGAGNLNVAVRAAEEIRRYISGHAEILKALGADLQDTGLEPWQKERILRNYVLQFREFREVTLFDETGGVVATSRVGPPRVTVPKDPAVTFDGVSMSRIRVDDDQLPTSVFAVELKRLNRPAGWLVGEISLEEMWRMVDEIRIGQEGYALLVAPDGTLLAHGDPDRKALVAQSVKVDAARHPGGGRRRARASMSTRTAARCWRSKRRSSRSTGRSSSSSRRRRPSPPPRGCSASWWWPSAPACS